jgi:hypothetical protein
MFVKPDGGTKRQTDITRLSEKSEDLSVRNMSVAVLELCDFFTSLTNMAT